MQHHAQIEAFHSRRPRRRLEPGSRHVPDPVARDPVGDEEIALARAERALHDAERQLRAAAAVVSDAAVQADRLASLQDLLRAIRLLNPRNS